jgi:membrane-associated phospholipid phosphatase
VAIGVATPLLRRRLRLPVPVVTVLSYQAPAALAVAAPRTKLRDAGIYALQMWAYFAHFDMPDDDPVAFAERVHVDYPIRADRVIGAGEEPTLRLQRALGRPGEIRPHDRFLSAVHWSWFAVPHGAMAYLLLRHRRLYPGSATLMAACFDLGCVVYWTVPTAPPWWAGANGSMAPVRRIMAETGERVWGRAWKPLYSSLEGNPFAAMPSLHFGTSVMAARLLQRVGPLHGAAAWAYALTLGFGLVYLGEHYVVDLVAGFALAEGIVRVSPRLEPLGVAVSEGLARLSP